MHIYGNSRSSNIILYHIIPTKEKRWEYNKSNFEFGMTFQIKTKIYTNVDGIINI